MADSKVLSPVTKKYRLLVGTHTQGGQTYRAWVVGEDELDLTEGQARALGKRVQEVGKEQEVAQDQVQDREVDSVSQAESSPSPAETTSLVLPVDLSKSIPEIEKDLQKVGDVKVLGAILAAEKKDRDRVGVEKAISARREELETEE